MINKTIQITKITNSNNVSVNVNGNGTCKFIEKNKLNSNKWIVEKLKTTNCKTPPKELADLLKQLFSKYQSNDGHWEYISQNYTPRAINRVISLMIKQHNRGERIIQHPAKLFTHLIKLRKKRRRFY